MSANEATNKRLRILIRGAVQGVGFRPFVYRLATACALTGWVNNTVRGVMIEVEGPADRLQDFLLKIEQEKPPLAHIQSMEHVYLDGVGFTSFEVRHSDDSGEKSAFVLPDVATCPDCLREIFDPADRRYQYPFTNCTNCGPRYSIIERLPYDRPHTSMAYFPMCPACEAEYNDPANRRFHAQPNACPVCGPQIFVWDTYGRTVAKRHNALKYAANAIRDGWVVAVKGLGGFHLMVDARNETAVDCLRHRKARDEKPLAIMVPDMASAAHYTSLSALEKRLLQSPEAPIVLLRKKEIEADLAPAIAPHNPNLGVMLPYTPLHHLLLAELGFPVVATSGNLSDEPICIDEDEALHRLHGIADLFLMHNRPIVRHVDDSVVRIVAGREQVLRRARGFAPLPITIRHTSETADAETILAVGAHLKNTVALAFAATPACDERQIFISQHIGDLETDEAYEAFLKVTTDLPLLYDRSPNRVACDLHPDYMSTHFAHRQELPVHAVQHHQAHVLACMAENELSGPVLGISWDGTGYGPDGTVWGGEFLRSTPAQFERVACWRPFPLPGGEKAIREPRRSALGLLYAWQGQQVFADDTWREQLNFAPREWKLLTTMLDRQVNAPLTSSVGRLFDAVAALLGLHQIVRFEGQAAMAVEFLLAEAPPVDYYSVEITPADGVRYVEWAPLLDGLLRDQAAGMAVAELVARFHNTLVEAIVAVAQLAGESQVVLSGGCFQNKYLTERTVQRLQAEGFKPYWQQRVPPNDGGIALGQAMAALHGVNTKALNP